MKIPVLVAVVALGTACGDMEHAPTDYTPAANRLATVGDDEPPPLTQVTAGEARAPSPAPATPPATAHVVTLQPLGATSLQGSVRLTPQGSGTLASISLQGGASATSYRGAVREGGCELLAADVVSLLDVTVDSAGRGSAATVLAIPTDSLSRRPHAVVYGKGGRPEACGEIRGPSARPASERSPPGRIPVSPEG